MRPLLPATALSFLLSAAAAAQIGPPVSQSFRPAELVVDVFSGHGAPGGTDSKVTVLSGPSGTGFFQSFGPADFAAARSGPPAHVLAAPPWAIQSLTTHPAARFISPDAASETGASTVAGLFAIDFEVPTGSIFSARMDFHFSSDDYLGWGVNPGIFINEEPVPDTPSFFGWNDQFSYEDLKVKQLLRPGTNTLYAYLVNTGGPGGLLFHARIRINALLPDECSQALPAYLGTTSGSTAKFTSSPETGACGIQNDRWYAFVPPLTGTLDATLSGSGTGYVPRMAVFSGACGALTGLACLTSQPLAFSGPVTAGVPVFLAIGGASDVTGDFDLELEVSPAQAGLVYPGNGHLYLLTAQETDFAGARAFAMQQGGYLASINDAAENAWIQSQSAAGSAVWIGLTDELSEGVWVWESGEPFVFSSWNVGEPNDAVGCGGEDYVEMLGGGLWNDLNTGLNPCGNHIRRGLVEVPASGLASVADLGGGCGLDGFGPSLYSEPHQLGEIATMAILDAPPGVAAVLFKSAPPAAPTPALDCVVHLDPGTMTLMGSMATGPYGSATFAFATPNDPLLIGTQEIWQAQLFPASGNLLYTDALESTLGN